MTFGERVGWFVLGMILGYLVKVILDTRKEGREVRDILRKRKEDESGFMRHPIIADIALVMVVAMCVFASFSTQSTNNKLEKAIQDIESNEAQDDKTQDRLARITVCTQSYLSQTIEALNQRTEYTKEQAEANVKLQLAQREFLELLIVAPPVSDEEASEAVENYVQKLTEFADLAGKQRTKVSSFPYPTETELKKCLEKRIP